MIHKLIKCEDSISFSQLYSPDMYTLLFGVNGQVFMFFRIERRGNMYFLKWLFIGLAVNAVALMLLFANMEGIKGLLEFIMEMNKFSDK